MPLALEITLILVLILLTLFLAPLFYQLRRTAQSLDLFLLSTRQDISQIAEDVHASRLRMDHLAETLQQTLADFSVFSKSVGDLSLRVRELHATFRTSLDSASRSVGGVMGGLSAVLAFFSSKQTKPATQEDDDYERR
jgi:predicted PurR-regulated permease PerM